MRIPGGLGVSHLRIFPGHAPRVGHSSRIDYIVHSPSSTVCVYERCFECLAVSCLLCLLTTKLHTVIALQVIIQCEGFLRLVQLLPPFLHLQDTCDAFLCPPPPRTAPPLPFLPPHLAFNAQMALAVPSTNSHNAFHPCCFGKATRLGPSHAARPEETDRVRGEAFQGRARR